MLCRFDLMACGNRAAKCEVAPNCCKNAKIRFSTISSDSFQLFLGIRVCEKRGSDSQHHRCAGRQVGSRAYYRRKIRWRMSGQNSLNKFEAASYPSETLPRASVSGTGVTRSGLQMFDTN